MAVLAGGWTASIFRNWVIYAAKLLDASLELTRPKPSKKNIGPFSMGFEVKTNIRPAAENMSLFLLVSTSAVPAVFHSLPRSVNHFQYLPPPTNNQLRTERRNPMGYLIKIRQKIIGAFSQRASEYLDISMTS